MAPKAAKPAAPSPKKVAVAKDKGVAKKGGPKATPVDPNAFNHVIKEKIGKQCRAIIENR